MNTRTLILFLLLIVAGAGARSINENPELWRFHAFPQDVISSLGREPGAPRVHAPWSNAPNRAAAGESPGHGRADETSAATGAVGEHVCERPPTKPLTKVARTPIHRWTDAAGKTHFSDKRPAGVVATIYHPDIRTQKQFFDFTITYEGTRPVPFLKDRLRAQVTKIYEVLAMLVGDRRLRQVELHLRLFERVEDYAAYAETISKKQADAGGFYSLEGNEAVTYQHPSDASTQATARHEAMHVISAGLFGGIPIWLNEGLAEYFEELTVEGQRAIIAPQYRWLEMAAQAMDRAYPTELRDYMNLGASEWYDTNRDIHYALAWSMVHFLMSSTSGRGAIAGYLQNLADHYCEPPDRFAWLERDYVNGYDGFARDFKAWLSLRQVASHTL